MPKRLMVVNVYFVPQSFGGATVVAEQLVQRLKERWQILVVTAGHDPKLPHLHQGRMRVQGVDVVRINLRPGNRLDQYCNPLFANAFAKVLADFKPDAVHFHSIQGMGAEMLVACAYADIPVAVTVHDNWWICERQFMIDANGRYCGMTKIDLGRCQHCMQELDSGFQGYGSTRYRYHYLGNVLRGADLLLFPSKFQQGLYAANLGAQAPAMQVNKNGVRPPGANFGRAVSDMVRLGFVGGIKGGSKGFPLVVKALEPLDPRRYELLVVDNTLNLGYSSTAQESLPANLNIRIVPAYTQDTVDTFFSTIDVLLFPSQVKESFGLTVREALLRDVWVICTDGGGTAEDVEDGVNGEVIPLDGDFLHLRKAIERTLSMDFRMYRNTGSDKIVLFDQQAEELNAYLTKMLTRETLTR